MKSPTLVVGGTALLAPPVGGPGRSHGDGRTLQTGQSGGCGFMMKASAADCGRSSRQCWIILFRLRLERNPKCRIFTNPLGGTCRTNRRMNSTASSEISLVFDLVQEADGC